MILKEIKARNFKRFSQLEVTNIPDKGIIGVLGLNESGKSTLGEVISYSLFGRTPNAGKGQVKSLLKWGAPFFETTISFEMHQVPYTLYRRFRMEGPSESYLLEDKTGTELAVGDKEVTQKITQLLGLGFEEFRHSIFVAQKELSLITDSRVRRKDVLEGLLGLNKLRDVDRNVAKQLQTLENERNLESIRLEEVQRLDEEVSRARAQVDHCLEARDSVMSERRQTREAIVEMEAQLKGMEKAREVLREVETLQSILTEKRESLKEVERQYRIAQDAQAHFDNLAKEMESFRAEIQNIQEDQKDLERKIRLYETYEGLMARLQGKKDDLAAAQEVLSELRKQKDEMDEAEAAAEARTGDLDKHLKLLEKFPTLESFENAVGMLKIRYEAVEKKYEGFRGKVHREVEKIDRLAEETREKINLISGEIPQTSVLAVDEKLIERLEEEAEVDPSAAMSWMGPVLGIVLVFTLMGVLVQPGLLAGLALIFIPYQKEKLRLKELTVARKRLKELKEQSKIYEEESRKINLIQNEKAVLIQELEKHEANLTYHQRLLAFWDDLPIETLEQVRETFEAMSEFRDSLTDELHGLIRVFLDECKTLEKFIQPKSKLEDFFQGNFRENYSAVLAEREGIQAEVANLKRKAVGKGSLMRQLESSVVKVAELKQVVEDLEKEGPSFRLPPEPLDAIRERFEKNSELMEACQQRIQKAGEERELARSLLGQANPLTLQRDSLLKELAEKTEILYQRKNELPEDGLTETDFAELMAKISDARERENNNLLEEARLSGNKEQLDETLRRLTNRQQDERRISQRMKLLERRREELVTLRECLAIALDRVRRRILPQIRAYFSHILARLTNNRYNEVELDEEFNLTVFSPEKGDLVDISQLSGGTADQMFIALRLALARSTSIGDGGPGRPFLFLDEPLSAFDVDRRAYFFQLLRGMEPNFQQIFMISHLPDVASNLDHYLTLSWDGNQMSTFCSWE